MDYQNACDSQGFISVELVFCPPAYIALVHNARKILSSTTPSCVIQPQAKLMGVTAMPNAKPKDGTLAEVLGFQHMLMITIKPATPTG